MTARCQGANSRLKPELPGIATLGTGAISGAIAALAPWASPVAILIEALNIDFQNQCGSDPPPMPTFDAGDVFNIAQGWVSPNFHVTKEKLVDLVLNWAWDVYCECVDEFVPPPIVPPLPPQGASYGAGQGVQPCWMGGWAGEPPATNGSFDPLLNWDVGGRLLPTDNLESKVLVNGGFSYTVYRIKTGVTRAEWTRKAGRIDAPTYVVGPAVEFLQFGPTNALIKRDALDWSSAAPQDSGVFSVNGNTTWMSAYAGYANNNAGNPPMTDVMTTVNMQWFCGSTSDTLSSCCPPDPAVALTLNNIFQLVQNTNSQIAQITSGWVDGTRHSNLSDTGSVLLVGDAKAVRVETHQPMPPLEELPGTPMFYWDMGFITPYVLQSPLRSTRITFNPQTVVLPQYTDEIGWTLYNGIVVDIVELVPPPE